MLHPEITSNYGAELWLGKVYGRGGWNWEIKGVDVNDFVWKARLCDDFIEVLISIKSYYEMLTKSEVENATANA